MLERSGEDRKGTASERAGDLREIRDIASQYGKTVMDADRGDVKPFNQISRKIISGIKAFQEKYPLEKSESSSRRFLNILKETTTVDNDQLEKDLISALNQAMKKHSDDFGVATGNNEILKNIEEDKKVEKILPALAGAAAGSLLFSNKTSQEGKKKETLKKGIGSALLAMLAGYALTPRVNPGEMTAAQQRQWERTLANQMRKKNIDLDSDTFKALQNFYKDQSDTYTRRKPAKNGVNLEKILTSPPFQGAEFDPTSHRWKKAGEVAAQTGRVNIATSGKRRIRGAGTGAAQRSVGGHKRGIVREARRGIAGRAARKKIQGPSRAKRGPSKTKQGPSRRATKIRAFKRLTQKR